MRIPVAWLRDFVDVPASPRELADALTLVGLAVDAVEGSGDGAVLDIDVTTNRVDCMNVLGVAREVAVIYGLPLRPPKASLTETGLPADQALGVAIEAGDLCARFCARVMDVRIGPSPAWLRDRLEMAGVRAINNIVDLTNYVMIEMGQPSHAFDLARVPGGRLIARWAREGEHLTTLDGTARRLGARNGVVAGPDGALAIAGVMGGAASEVSDETRVVALEAAYWEPLAIRRSAKALAMHTEASHRFERGADPEGPAVATERLAHLLLQIDAGSVRPGLIDVVARAVRARSARLRPARANAVLGVEVPAERQGKILRGLGFVAGAGDGQGVPWTIPTWRGDVTREADLVEEVGRHFGIDRVPSTLPASTRAEGLRTHQRRERALRDLLIGAGLSEAINYAFVASARAAADPAPRVPLANPLSSDQDVLRSSLTVPGLLESLARNLRQGRRDAGLFEIGRVFSPGEALPREERRLGLVLMGEWRGRHWSNKGRPADFYDAKGIVEALAHRLGGTVRLRAGGAPAFLHPGRSARVAVDGAPMGWLGLVHPDVARDFDLRGDVVAAELGLETLLTAPRAAVRARSLPRFPEVNRDLSVVWPASRESAELRDLVTAAAGERLIEVAVVDRYAGPGIPEGRVSLTISLRFQDEQRTLTGEEVQAAVSRVVASLKDAGAEIRGE
jgi:phenylalanyl-tRNA synthetase beta chain